MKTKFASGRIPRKTAGLLSLFIFFSAFANAQSAWTQKTSLPSYQRYSGVGFSIGTKGYIGAGLKTFNSVDFWEWNQASDTWQQIANVLPSGARVSAVGFSIGSTAYFGTGDDLTADQKDFYSWTPNTWVQKTNLGGLWREGAVGFSIGTKGYIGTGS